MNIALSDVQIVQATIRLQPVAATSESSSGSAGRYVLDMVWTHIDRPLQGLRWFAARRASPRAKSSLKDHQRAFVVGTSRCFCHPWITISGRYILWDANYALAIHDRASEIPESTFTFTKPNGGLALHSIFVLSELKLDLIINAKHSLSRWENLGTP